MPLIELDLLNDLLTSEIKSKEEEVKHAVKNEWYDKAAKLNNEIAGIKKASLFANSGDCHTSKS
tara:strand:- start:194 stop:385 length:192 start_codon:yes stop_codon:yes gene_type:complete